MLPATSEHGVLGGEGGGGGFRCLVTDGESPNSREHALKARAASSALLPSLAVGAIGARNHRMSGTFVGHDTVCWGELKPSMELENVVIERKKHFIPLLC